MASPIRSPVRVTAPPNIVACGLATMFTLHAVTTMSDVKRPRKKPGPRRCPRQRSTSRPMDVKVKAPSRPNEYMSPRSSRCPLVRRTTATGTKVARRMAR